MKFLKTYQDRAINKLLNRTKELFEEKKEDATIIFQSPTGSGKTFMISKYIEEVIKEFKNEELCFLWLSIGAGMLHKQSYYSLKKTFNGFPSVYLLEDEFHGGRSYIRKDEVVIINWDKINKQDKLGDWTNTLMQDSETYNFIDIIKNTQDLGTKIIMIIDESHTGAKSERALELRHKIIQADLTIEMSATPVIKEYDEIIKINPKDVIEEGMIKKEIIVNDSLELYKTKDITSEELILKTAISKRTNLSNLYKKNDLNINPLCLIQIPNAKAGKQKLEFIEEYLAKYNISYENGKLAIWLNKDKINLDMLNDNENKVECLIFIKAIATGWDCPRAQILVKFVDTKSEILEIQTVGRILRMPEAEHYTDDDLNRAFLYINTDEFSVKKEEYNLNIIKSLFSIRKNIYNEMNLNSYYLNRVDYGDITRNIYGDLEDIFCKEFGLDTGKYELFDNNKKIISKKISLEAMDSEAELIDEKHLDTLKFDDLYSKKIISNEKITVKYSSADLDNIFEKVVQNNLNGFAQVRSTPILMNGIRRWFKQYLGISARETFNGHIKIRNIFLTNRKIFEKLLNEVTLKYKFTKAKELELKVEELEKWNENWEVSQNRAFNSETYRFYNYKLSLYQPCYLNLDSDIEQEFIEFIENNSDNILWWWQNGNEHMALNFGIKYKTKSMTKPYSTFQPDFLIMFKNAQLGIFDTKAIGYQEDDNKIKAEALQKYIKDENFKNKNLFGGIVIKDNNGYFKINQQEEYKSFNEAHEEWIYFEDLLN